MARKKKKRRSVYRKGRPIKLRRKTSNLVKAAVGVAIGVTAIKAISNT